jgi:hypothetical protein
MDYNFKEHKHRYGVWTAARAVQRSFTTTTNISFAINKTSLRFFAEMSQILDQETFDKQHKEWSQSIIETFKSIPIECSYGRAAKIIAIYLKTSYVIASEDAPMNRIIHPPIDGILLASLSTIDNLLDFKSIRWTKLDETAYWKLVDRIRLQIKSFDWQLESHWKPELDNINEVGNKI